MVEHIIVQAGHLVVPAATAAHHATTTSRLLPIVIILGLLFMFSRLRGRSRQAAGDPRGVRRTGRPGSPPEPTGEPTGSRESDTDPTAGSEHTHPE